MNLFKGLILFLCFFFTSSCKLNAQQDEGCKYLAVITHIRTNQTVSEKLKQFFPALVKRKQLFVDFGLCDKVSFLNISGFEARLKEKKYILNDTLINNPNLYYKRHYFISYESDLLRQIKWNTESKLFLSFSKPIDNYLIAEITDFDPGKYGGSKFGKGMKMFIKLNTSGLVDEILFSGAVFN